MRFRMTASQGCSVPVGLVDASLSHPNALTDADADAAQVLEHDHLPTVA
jgi:hypothetical protein